MQRVQTEQLWTRRLDLIYFLLTLYEANCACSTLQLSWKFCQAHKKSCISSASVMMMMMHSSVYRAVKLFWTVYIHFWPTPKTVCVLVTSIYKITCISASNYYFYLTNACQASLKTTVCGWQNLWYAKQASHFHHMNAPQYYVYDHIYIFKWIYYFCFIHRYSRTDWYICVFPSI